MLDELPANVELVDVAKLPRGRSALQAEINRILIDRARAGKRVVRFKGGDSFVFGRGFEELVACREAGVPVTVVPGLSSALAVPALQGIPVTHAESPTSSPWPAVTSVPDIPSHSSTGVRRPGSAGPSCC